jgi:sugar phosphate permease
METTQAVAANQKSARGSLSAIGEQSENAGGARYQMLAMRLASATKASANARHTVFAANSVAKLYGMSNCIFFSSPGEEAGLRIRNTQTNAGESKNKARPRAMPHAPRADIGALFT